MADLRRTEPLLTERAALKGFSASHHSEDLHLDNGMGESFSAAPSPSSRPGGRCATMPAWRKPRERQHM